MLIFLFDTGTHLKKNMEKRLNWNKIPVRFWEIYATVTKQLSNMARW